MVDYLLENKPQMSRVGVCTAYPSFDKPFLKVYADKRRYAPQRTLRTQSIALTIFAVFAPFAVKFVEGGAK